ncbi:MAG: hypothetical protein CBB70_08815 [Planctomycetaceae bacterium TMED10]|nr:MAG: hypothetical protein CBB70_08815 [Planctomycetaceae bacterium TMED10]
MRNSISATARVFLDPPITTLGSFAGAESCHPDKAGDYSAALFAGQRETCFSIGDLRPLLELCQIPQKAQACMASMRAAHAA